MARWFRGEWTHRVDGKGRVSIPAPFRRVLEEGDPEWKEGLQPNFVIVYGRPGKRCLECYSMRGIERIDEQISRMPRFSKKREAFNRLFHSQSQPASVDETGRIVLTGKLRDHSGIADEAMFVGMGDFFQIWEEGALAADQAALMSAIEEEVGADGDLFALLEEIPDE